MIAVIQRVTGAAVEADGEPYSEIGQGLLVLLGVASTDNEGDAALLSKKIAGLRIFSDAEGKLNLSVSDIGGEILVVPNFTLLASYKKGNRPDFLNSAKPDEANRLFEHFCSLISEAGIKTSHGKFRSSMKVELVNDGPITIVMDSRVLRGEREV